jgi:hypothetical protein
VRLSVAAGLKVDGTVNAPAAGWKDGVARLVGALVHLKPLPAEREHLRHEWHAVELTVAIERPENLLFASNRHPIAGAQF